jgi:hypothetical protein
MYWMEQNPSWEAYSYLSWSRNFSLFIDPKGSLPCTRKPTNGPYSETLCNISCHAWFYSKQLLAPCPTPKLEDHSLSAARGFLFSIFAATLHIWRVFSYICNLRTRHAMVTRDPLNIVNVLTTHWNLLRFPHSLHKLHLLHTEIYYTFPINLSMLTYKSEQLYSVCSTKGNDVVCYIIIKKLLDSIFNILPVFIHQWEIQTHWIHTSLARWQKGCMAENVKTYNSQTIIITIFYFYYECLLFLFTVFP